MSDAFRPLGPWGWDPSWEGPYEEALSLCPRGLNLEPARVVGREGPHPLLETLHGPRRGLVSGRLEHRGQEADLPLVGDWAAVQVVDEVQAVVHGVVGRRSFLARSVDDRQTFLAANLDRLAIVMGLDGNFNPRRAQRLATLARHGGIEPLWILTKADLEGAEDRAATARRAAGSDPVVLVSAHSGQGWGGLEAALAPGLTIALVGSSGVGKTTLAARLGARLAGAEPATGGVRASNSKGRHTTTSRHLYLTEGGRLIMDTPGLRTVALWATEDDLDEGFPEISALAAQCRFGDCRHQGEPGCAVAAALEAGTLEPSRWDGWRRQQRELAHLARRDDRALQQAEKERWKAVAKFQKSLKR